MHDLHDCFVKLPLEQSSENGLPDTFGRFVGRMRSRWVRLGVEPAAAESQKGNDGTQWVTKWRHCCKYAFWHQTRHNSNSGVMSDERGAFY
ncbi:hypothetical protein niasHT_002643 [Heterodera trifolii]|uniref:Uncharacterized protein n=1 Tax=Heterodera trifolii TaxID=157864 RepID=A0ABD2LU79_9BILA